MGDMYIKDLTPYVFLNREPNANLLAVGWLDAEHEFTKGTVPDAILERVLALCFKRVNQTRGIHRSPFFKNASGGYIVQYNGKKMGLGSAEIRVEGLDGKYYAAPNLIYHYIKDCGYLPPQEFIEALSRLQLTGESSMHGNRRKPIFGVACVIVSILAIIPPFLFGPERGGEIDIYLRYVVPVIAGLFVILALIRRERIVWWIVGLILTMVYVGLHCIAIP